MRKAVIAVLIVVVSLAVLAPVHRHHIRTASKAELFWSPAEAYLFVNTIRMGWAPTYLQLATTFLREFSGGGTPPERTRRSLTVVWFNSDTMESRTIDDMEAQPSSLEGGAIFNGPGSKWSRTRLEQTSADEQRRYSRSLPWKKPPSSNPVGWAYDCCVLPARVGETKHAVELNGLPLQLIVRHDRNDQISFVLQGQHAAEKILLPLDEQTKHVTQHEYDTLMQK